MSAVVLCASLVAALVVFGVPSEYPPPASGPFLWSCGVICISPWIAVLDELSIILLFFGVLLTYLATAAFAASLGRARWLGRAASRIIVVTNLVAASLEGIRVVEAVRSA